MSRYHNFKGTAAKYYQQGWDREWHGLAPIVDIDVEHYAEAYEQGREDADRAREAANARAEARCGC